MIDTVGMNDKAWLDLLGHPRTEKAHIIERYTRPELGRINIEITIDDPGAYSKPWKVYESSQLAPGWELASTSATRTIAICRIWLESETWGQSRLLAST